ncbi:hypothetical protein WN943_015595 [Citrus x changshan-huyou]
MCYARSSIRSTIDRYKKACSDNSNSGTVTEINAQESAKLRQQIQMLQNSNRHLMGDSLSSLTVKELRNWRTGLSEASLGSGPRRRLSWKMKVCVSDQSTNGEVSVSKHGDWARAECNPCISFSEFLQSRYHRGWWHRLLSPGQEDTLSRVNNSSITFHFYVLALHVHQRFLPFAGKLDTGDQACGISARDL